jgi:Cu2+-exporting ATPase
VLARLKERGVKRIVVLTGDHKDTALALQRQLPQIDDIHFELKPEDKAEVVERLKAGSKCVGFVGDGVNDAPALVNAHVGICMPKGADLAKEAAQVLLLKEDLTMLALAREAAGRTNSVIRQCFYATIGFNSVTILMALMGLQPAVAAVLHNMSTIGILGYAGAASSRRLGA